MSVASSERIIWQVRAGFGGDIAGNAIPLVEGWNAVSGKRPMGTKQGQDLHCCIKDSNAAFHDLTPKTQARKSNRSAFITLFHAATKSRTNLSCASALA